VHKTVNVLNKLPKSLQAKAKRALQDIWMAETKKEALAAFDAFVETYGVKYDKAVACLVKDRDALLAFYDVPAEHWKHLRTTNPIESTFATIRHRTVRAKGCLSNKTALAMIFKLAQADFPLFRKLLACQSWLVNVNRILPTVLALALAQSAEAACQDRPRPHVDWTGCSRSMLMLGGDDLTEGVFSRAMLTSTGFRRSKLAGAKLDEAELSFTRFEDADLSGADLSKAVGWRANFTRTHLDHANFSGADLSRAILVEAKIAGADFRKAEVNRGDFSRADLSGADFSKAEAARAVFTEATLSGARFTYAALARADLKKLDLAGVDLTGAYLFLAQLDGADLSRASGLKQDQLSLACGTSETKLPAGMVQPDSWPCRPESD
jgi:uncharacterized protein YjbI with pentapeptide repeats